MLNIKPPKNLSHLFNELNSFSPGVNKTPVNLINSNYYDFDQIQTIALFRNGIFGASHG